MTSKVKAASSDKNIDIQINIENNLFSKNKCDGLDNKSSKKNKNTPQIQTQLGEIPPADIMNAAAGEAEARLYGAINPNKYSTGTFTNRFAQYRNNQQAAGRNRWNPDVTNSFVDDMFNVDPEDYLANGYIPDIEIEEPDFEQQRESVYGAGVFQAEEYPLNRFQEIGDNQAGAREPQLRPEEVKSSTKNPLARMYNGMKSIVTPNKGKKEPVASPQDVQAELVFDPPAARGRGRPAAPALSIVYDTDPKFEVRDGIMKVYNENTKKWIDASGRTAKLYQINIERHNP